MKRKTRRSRLGLALAVLGSSLGALALAAVNAHAAGGAHTIVNACSVTAPAAPGVVYANCRFPMPSGSPNTYARLAYHKLTGAQTSNHTWAALTQSWDTIAQAGKMASYSPQMNIKPTCSTAMNNYANAQGFPSGFIYLGADYVPRSGGQDTANIYCPSNKPFMMYVYGDTRAYW